MHPRSRLSRSATHRPLVLRMWPSLVLLGATITGMVIVAVGHDDIADEVQTFLQALRRAL
ncbi:hypothetical protein ACFSM7_02510 [Clavibacter michiganensis subsp. tessellarius]|uniref:hypothetical protein n=1 Tax=Clavibacter tessellarius TaxID=31965 RepID=UPI00363F244E